MASITTQRAADRKHQSMPANTNMSEEFDAYHAWLGIPPSEQPPDHYRLLGLSRFESSRQAIVSAYDQRMAHLRSFQNGPRAAVSQRLLNEIAKAYTCLLNPRRKAMYDQHLESQENAQKSAAASWPPTDPELAKISVRPKKASRTPRTRPAWLIGAAGVSLLVGLVAAFLTFRERTEPSHAETSASNPLGADRPWPDPANARPSQAKDIYATGSTTAQGAQEARGAQGAQEARGNSKATSVQGANSASVNPTLPVSPPRGSGNLGELLEGQEKTPAEVSPRRPKGPRQSATPAKFALRFRGNDWLELADTHGMLDLRRPFSVEMWVRFDPAGDSHYLVGDMMFGPNHPDVTGGNPAGWQFWIMKTENGRQRVAAATGKGFAAEYLLRERVWRHFAFCVGAERFSIFVDGRQAAAQPISTLLDTWVPSPSSLFIGGHKYLHATQPVAFRGEMRGFRVSSGCRYNENFAPVELLENDETTEVLLDFSQASEQRVADLSGGGHDGLIQGAQWFALDELPDLTSAKPTLPAAAGPPAAGNASAVTKSPPKAAAPQPRPSADELQAARNEVRQLFKVELAKKDDSKHSASLAQRFLDLAQENRAKPAAQLALLEEASDLAAAIGDLQLANTIIDVARSLFEVDVVTWKSTLFKSAAESARDSELRKKLATAGSEWIAEFARAGEFNLASETAQVAITIAGRAKEAELVKSLREQKEELLLQRKRWMAAHQAEEQLKAEPGDPKLNEAWGLFLAVQQEEWETALPFLAKAGNESLRRAATADQEAVNDPEQQLQVGNLWWDAAQSVDKKDRLPILERAELWYRAAEPQAKGLARAQVEKRLKEIKDLAPLLVTKKSVKKRNSPALPQTIDAPPGRRGLAGRVQVDDRDIGVLWTYLSGVNITDENFREVLSQVGVKPGRSHLEFIGSLFVPPGSSVSLRMTGGTGKVGHHILFIDGKKAGEVGVQKDTQRFAETLDLRPGEHALRWVLTGTELGNSSLQFIDEATGKPLLLQHSQALVDTLRNQPFRTTLNVNMTR